MANTNLNFEKFAQDAHAYINKLAEDLGHPEEQQRALIIWRAVMHTIRDRIHLGESFHILNPLPMIFKGIYVEDWKYSEKPRLDYDTMEMMKNEIKKLQSQYGEQEFNWNKSTEEIVYITLNSLKDYISEGHMGHIVGRMPKEIKSLFKEEVY